MKRLSASSAVDLVKKLRLAIEPCLPENARSSSIFVDMADVYGICSWYQSEIESIVRRSRPITSNQLSALLVKLDVELLEHMKYHQQTMRKSISRIVRAMEAGNRPRPRKASKSARK